MLCLISRVAEVGEHVCPNALVLGGGKAGQIVAGPNLAATAQVITVVQSFALGQSQPVPFLIPVAQASVNLPLIHPALKTDTWSQVSTSQLKHFSPFLTSLMLSICLASATAQQMLSFY